VILIGSGRLAACHHAPGLHSAQDRGYVIISAQLPGAASLTRTTEIVRRIESIALDTPGISHIGVFAGLSGATRTQASNSAALFPVFEEPEVRLKKGLNARVITADLRKRLSAIEGAFIIVIPPPPIPGIGTGGGFTMRIQDRQGRGPKLLAAATDELVAAARKSPLLLAPTVFSPFSANTPQVFVDIDQSRRRSSAFRFQTSPTRSRPISARPMSTTSTCSAAPITSPRRPICVPQGDRRSGPPAYPKQRGRYGAARQRGGFPRHVGSDRVARYNLYPASELQGDTLREPAPRPRSDTMKRLAAETLPSGFPLNGPTCRTSRSPAAMPDLYVFPICVLFVFLVLAAQYGSWSLPFARHPDRADVPAGRDHRGADHGTGRHILTQIGFVVSGRPRRQKRDSDRGVRPRHRARGALAPRCRDRGLAA
jgi:hypothetical protein